MAAALLCPGAVAGAAAAVFTVTGTADNTSACSNGHCPSLRSAVLASNNAGGANTIKVPAGQYKLTLTPNAFDNGLTGDLHITANVTILGAGSGPGGTTVIGDGDRIFDISAGRVTLAGVAMTGGSQENTGGAIEDTGASLTLANDLLQRNTTTSDGGFGGAVSMESKTSGALIVRNTTFRSNTAAESEVGGGGFGGAIDFEPGTTGRITVINSEFDLNTAQSGKTSGGGFGGAISFEPSDAGSVTITGTTFNGNLAAGSSSQGGFGGAISFEPGSSPSTLTITNSTLNRNRAGGLSAFGGAIDWEPGSGSSGTLRQVTLAGNSIPTKNQGGGIWVQDAPLTIENSIVSGNTGGGVVDNCTSSSGGVVTAKGHNIELGKTCGFDINANPLLLTLANNGGPTQTMGLALHSPAKDRADPAFCPKTDQRGAARPDDAGTPCDIGAFESLAPPHGTRITGAAVKRSARSAKFSFVASGRVSGFQCALTRVGAKKAPFRACKSPKSFQHLSHGQYIFKVRAVNSAGVDPRPASRKFTI
jgi:hypothetical protein